LTHVMLDLETMGTRAGCAILSIGAVVFEPRNGSLRDEFYQSVFLEGQDKLGLHTSDSTLKWWNAQSEEARKVLTCPDRMELGSALDKFQEWLPINAYVWGNGADFDNPILAAAYAAFNMPQPWKPYNGRCYRTIKNLAPDLKLARSGTHHNALDDAKSQAEHIMAVAMRCNLTLA